MPQDPPWEQGLDRRSFLKTCGTLAVLAGAPWGGLEKAAAAIVPVEPLATEKPDHVTLSWMGDPKTTQTLTWRTNTAVLKGQVQYIEAGREALPAAAALRAPARVRTLFTDLGMMNIHSATLKGLKPGTTYLYRVGADTNWSATASFTTEAAGSRPFEILLFGDSQSGDSKKADYGPWHTTLHNAYQAHPAAAFFMVLGDHVEIGQSYAHWNQWFAASAGVIDRLPLMDVEGNHETYNTQDLHPSLPAIFTGQSSLPLNGPEGLKGQVYSFDYGDAHFAVLDSQVEEEGPFIDRMLELEAAWLDADLSRTDRKWKLVMFHKTPYYNRSAKANEALKAVLTPVFDKHRVDLVFNGHDHGYSRTYPIDRDTPVASPARGTVYVVAGRSGNKTYPDLSKKVWDAFFYDPQAEPNYLAVKVDGDRLTLTAHQQSGALIDTYTIDKAAGTDSPATALPPRPAQTGLVVYGSLAPLENPAAHPCQLEGFWYVPAAPFFKYLQGTVAAGPGGSLDIKYEKKKIHLEPGTKGSLCDDRALALGHPVVLREGEAIIAADDLQTVAGFSHHYDAAMNLILFAK